MDYQLKLKQQDFGPLVGLIGIWQGENGIDMAPEEDGEEINTFRETLTFEPIEEVVNAESQVLRAIAYRQVVVRIVDGKMIHHECGYYSWEPENSTLMKSFSIPRGIAIVAGGKVEEIDAQTKFIVAADLAGNEWSIAESPFMAKQASTQSYQSSMTLEGDSLSYSQEMQLNIYGNYFLHKDNNQLVRVNASI